MTVMKAFGLPIESPVESTRSVNPSRVVTTDKSTTAPLTTVKDAFLGQVLRVLAGGATRPEAFTLLLKLLSYRFDHTDTGGSYTKLHNFGLSNGTPFHEFS